MPDSDVYLCGQRQDFISKTIHVLKIAEFIHKQDRSSQKFFTMLTSTQLFAAFVESRSFASCAADYGGENAGKAASLVFFDECIDRLRGEYASSVRLIEGDDALSR